MKLPFNCFNFPFFFATRSQFLCAFYLVVLENELTFTVRGSFEETQRVPADYDSCSALPDSAFFHYARYKQPSLDIALAKTRRLPAFVCVGNTDTRDLTFMCD